MKNFILAFSLFLSSVSYAQDSVNAHGFDLVPTDGDLKDGLSTWRAESHEKESVAGNLLFEYAAKPLTLHQIKDGVETETVLIRDLTALNLGVFVAPLDRWSVTLSTPIFLSTETLTGTNSLSVGDLRLASPVTLLKPDQELSLGVSVIPFWDIPGWSSDLQLGSSGFSGGGLVAASLGDDTWDVSANVGMLLSPEVDFYNLRGKEKLLANLSASYLLSDSVAIRGELISKPSLRDNDFNGTESPVEVLASIKGHATKNLGFTLGAGKALNRGVSAATWRAFGGLDCSFGARSEKTCPDCPNSKLWVSTEGPEPDITLTDGSKTLKVKHGDVVTLPPGGDYLIKVKTEPCVEVVQDKILLLKPIVFDFDQATIRMPDSYQVMTELVQTMKDHPEISLLEIATGTDTRGSAEYNKNLSARRAESVKKFLVDAGIAPEKLTTVGYGEDRLIVPNCKTEECHEKNRYAIMTILKRTE